MRGRRVMQDDDVRGIWWFFWKRTEKNCVRWLLTCAHKRVRVAACCGRGMRRRWGAVAVGALLIMAHWLCQASVALSEA